MPKAGIPQRGGQVSKTRMSGRSAVAGLVLIIEDDPNIASLVSRYLGAAGFQTIEALDGERGLQLARTRHPLLVIVDLMLPKIDGWDICRELRRASDVPIVILTSREAEIDRVLGFTLGADDYVVKPFSPRELVERVKAILRRTGDPTTAGGRRLERGELALEPDKRKVTLGGDPVLLTPSEFRLLHVLMRHPGRVFSRRELLGRLQTRGQMVVDRVIDVHIGKLRQKIETEPARPRYILTVHGMGYRFCDPTD